MRDASLAEISTGKSRMAGECLQMEVAPGCINIVIELLNSLPAFFAVIRGEPLRILSLWCSLPAVFKGILDPAILQEELELLMEDSNDVQKVFQPAFFNIQEVFI